MVLQQDQNTAGDGALKSESLLDGFGRLSGNDTYETSSQYIAATQAYDAMGRIASTTNPSRPGDSLGYATTYNYDSLGRMKSVVASDGVTTTSSYSGNVMTLTDAAGHTKSFTLNGLGQLKAVSETIESGSIVNTFYSYDALGNLVCVSQTACPGSPTRSFTYDSLKRLVTAVNPESGTITYSYDSDGNQTSRTDNRGITTTYTYDALNRLKTVTYPSPYNNQNVTYSYDSGGTNSIGHLVSISSGSTTNYTAFDTLGRVLSSNQVTIGTTYPFAYTYNLAGSLTSETYPSGRVVSASYDGANRPVQISGILAGQTTKYLTGAWYWPHGEVGYYTLANSIVPAFAFNRHFQPTKIYAAINDSTSSLLFMDCYNWGAPNADSFLGTCPAWTGTNDNGNLYGSVTYTGPSSQSSLTAYTDTFAYDGLNRLTSASDSGGWSRAFSYDQSANMWVTGWTGPGLNSATPTSNVYNSKNQMSSVSYDASGNQLKMGSYTINYDAENHQISESNTIGNPAASYSYDGNGKRVVRMVGTQTTVYVYDAFGALAAAYSNGAMGTPPCHTCYLTYDHLGTTRMITDPNANVIARHDFLPFGEEIPGGIAGRSSKQFGPGLDNINQKFTGQERDSETGLDFLQARYLGGALGRFLSPDPKNAGVSLGEPQTWNAYAYVSNNPLSGTDPSGRVEEDEEGSDDGGGGDPSSTGGGGGGGGLALIPSGGDASTPGSAPLGAFLLGSTYVPGGPGGSAIFGNDVFDALSGAPNTTFSSGPGGQLSYGFAPPSPIAYQFSGMLFGKTYTQTFSSFDAYAGWRTGLAAEPENQAYTAYMLDCAHSATPCTGNNTVTTRYQGITGNYALVGYSLDPSSMSGMIQDPSAFSNAMHGADSWYTTDLIDAGHVTTSQDGFVESHVDAFNGVLLTPFHFLADVLPSFFINPKPGVQGATYTCSPVGGCH